MSSNGSINVQGLADLHRALQQLPAKIEANVLTGGLRAGANVIAQDAIRRIPEGTGQLKQTVRLSTMRRNGKVTVAVKAGSRTKVSKKGKISLGAYYAHFVEYGTAPHEIKPKNRKSLVIAGIFRELVKHPGARAKPFMRPAFDSQKQAAIEAVRDYIAARLPKEIAKQGPA